MNRSVLTCIGARQRSDTDTSTTVTRTALCFNSNKQHVNNNSAVASPADTHSTYRFLCNIAAVYHPVFYRCRHRSSEGSLPLWLFEVARGTCSES